MNQRINLKNVDLIIHTKFEMFSQKWKVNYKKETLSWIAEVINNRNLDEFFITPSLQLLNKKYFPSGKNEGNCVFGKLLKQNEREGESVNARQFFIYIVETLITGYNLI